MSKFDFEAFINQYEAESKSNNWRRLHGYPLRRKMYNSKSRKDEAKRNFMLGAPGCGKSRFIIMPSLEQPASK